MTTDAVLTIDPETSLYDISIDEEGDIETDDFFDTAILYSIFGERRASENEIVEPQLRRGWIGNEGKDFENGSKIWTLEQAKLTRTNLNKFQDFANQALIWFVEDGFAVAIRDISASPSKNSPILLSLTIERSRSKVERRFYELWQNTGIR